MMTPQNDPNQPSTLFESDDTSAELQRYRSLVENAVEGIFQTTPEGRYRMANPMLARIYGYDSPTELMQGLTDIAQQLYVDPSRREEFLEILHTRGAVWGFESPVFRRDGAVIWISECARVVYDAEGNLWGYEGTVEDITRRKQAEVERANALSDLEKAQEELEARVRERTAELEAAHRELTESVVERKRFYREVIRCVTQDRLCLVDARDIPDPGEVVREGILETLRDEQTLRAQVREVAREAGMMSSSINDLTLAVGEAATNAIKHAPPGRYLVYRDSNRIAIRIRDEGTGIRAEDIPATILQPGFSTKVSLGMGYTLMLELADRVFLATGPTGTVLQLEKWLRTQERPEMPIVAWGKL